jgi:hypothetical protein
MSSLRYKYPDRPPFVIGHFGVGEETGRSMSSDLGAVFIAAASADLD